MSHLAYPPLTPVSPLPHPRDQTQARLSSQNLTMYAESARIQKVSIDISYLYKLKTGRESTQERSPKREHF